MCEWMVRFGAGQPGTAGDAQRCTEDRRRSDLRHWHRDRLQQETNKTSEQLGDRSYCTAVLDTELTDHGEASCHLLYLVIAV